MKIYGEIQTNIGKIIKKKGTKHLMNIDTLTFGTEYGDNLDIDFDEVDYQVEDDKITFRLKGLGATFAEYWQNIEGRTPDVDIEKDYELFKNSELYEIQLYVQDSEELLNDELCRIGTTNISMIIDNKELTFSGNVDIEIVG